MKPKTQVLIPILSIAGSDCSGGAGIQADLKTFSAHGLFGMSVLLSVVAENTKRVISVYNLDPKLVDEQLLSVFEDIPPKAVKIGMIGSLELMKELELSFYKYTMSNVVIDPVMFAKNGAALMDVKNSLFFKEKLVKHADILTPNIPEANYLCDMDIKNLDDMKEAAKILFEAGAKSVLIKGGHTKNSQVQDVFYEGGDFNIFKDERIETKNTHGTGCTLSSAIACNLAKGLSKKESIKRARAYIREAIYYSLDLGKGHGPTNHFFPGFESFVQK